MTRRHLRRSLTCVLWLSVASVHAQAPVFRSATRLVVLHATVTNRHGDPVTNLDEQAFAIFENGKRQPITIFRRDDVPVSIGLLIDNSGSMRSLRTKVEAAALAFARASNPQDEMFVLNFADTSRLDVPMTSDLQVLERGIGRVDSIGGTAMRDAIETAEDYLRDHAKQDRRVLLVITDGIDNASTASAEAIQRQAERTETVIDAVGLFHAQDASRASEGRRELNHLTERSGGVAYFPESVDQVASVTIDLARRIRAQYTIAYTPTNQALDGSYRTIRVTASGAERYTVKTRAGYRAIPDTQPKESGSPPNRSR
jgi:VWFA-related protein